MWEVINITRIKIDLIKVIKRLKRIFFATR